MSRQRFESVDIVKGLAIFLMVLGHSYSENNGQYVIQWIYSFHMPLFFITTGVLYGMQSKKIIEFNIKKRVLTLLWPYLFWNVAYQMFLFLLKIKGGWPIIETLKNCFLNVVMFNGSAMWFLPAMFGAVMVFALLHRFISNRYMLLISSILIMIICFICSPNDNMFFTIIIQLLVGAGFISIGYFLAKIYNQKCSIVWLMMFTTIHLVLTFINRTVGLAELTFGNPILYIIVACLGTFVIFQWCKRINTASKIGEILKLWGENSIKVLCLHGFIVQIIRLFDYKVFGDTLPKLGYGEGVVLSLSIMLIISFVLRIRCPFWDMTFGKFDNRSIV